MIRHLRSLIVVAGIALLCLTAGAFAQRPASPIGTAPRMTAQRGADLPGYFPLEVGNEWVYSDGVDTFTVQVQRETQEVNGTKYFEVSGYFPNDTAKTRKLRRDSLGRIRELNPAGEDFLWYQFGNVRGAWQFVTSGQIPCVTGSRVSFGEIGATVDVPAGVFQRTLRLRFVSPCADAGIAGEYFAGGVGLVKRVLNTFAGPRTVHLVAAHVGGLDLPASSYGIGISLDRPFYFNNLMPPVINPWPTAKVRLVVRNETGLPVELMFPTSQRFEFIVRDATGKEILRWSDGRVFLPVVSQETLLRESRTYSADITLKSREGRPLPAGYYTMTGFVTTQESGHLNMTSSVTFEIRNLY
jgi:hypothetical protein